MRRLLTIGLALALCGCGDDRVRPTLPPGVWVDAYLQRSTGQVDVLWVVDNSGSMEPRQQNLARNFQAFMDVFSRTAIDFRIGVTTTDIFTSPGQLHGSPAILSPSTPDVVARFGDNVRVGTDGSAFEAGFHAAKLTLDQLAQAKADALAAGAPVTFLRDGAYLYLIFVTDEDDRSDGDLRSYWRHFETAKGVGNDGTVTTAAIVGDVPQNDCGATPAERYVELSALTGGEVGSICDAEFAQSLRALATSAVGLKRKFALTRPPSPETLTVRLYYPCGVDAQALAGCAQTSREACQGRDGSVLALECLPPQGGPDGWRFEDATDTVYFAGASLPGLGAEVNLQYYEEGHGP
jgi:hypothetical protein